MKLPARILAVAAIAAAWAVPVQAKPIVVGGKNFTEQLLLTEITAQLLAKKGFEIEKRDGLGSQVLRDAQVNGQVDVYWEYTGTSLVTYNKVNERLDAKDTYERVKALDAKLGLTWLKPSAAVCLFDENSGAGQGADGSLAAAGRHQRDPADHRLLAHGHRSGPEGGRAERLPALRSL
ncbi:hypothetical protein BTHI11S_02077 [Bosea thiooxidans]